jgi:hypothetical protein
MNRRIALVVGVLSILSLWPIGASAAFKTPWAGEWAGTTEKGDAVALTISGSSVTAYQFKGQNVAINSSEVGPKTAIFHVGYLNGEIRLTRTGEASAAYAYSASDGGHAHAKLIRR